MGMRQPSVDTQNGFSLTELLLSIGFTSMAGLLLIVAMTFMNMQIRRSSAVSLAIELQSEIIAALQDESQFVDSNRNPKPQLLSLQTGNCAGARGLELRGNDAARTVIAVAGFRIGFTSKKIACDPRLSECLVRVDLDFLPSPSGGGCVADYRVSLSQAATQIQMAPFGSPFQAKLLRSLLRSEFAIASSIGGSAPKIPLGEVQNARMNGSIPLNYDIVTQLAKSECPTTDGIFVNRITRQSGEVGCVRPNQILCRSGQIMKGVQVVNGRLEPICQDLMVARCPQDYVWSGIDLSVLDSRSNGGVYSPNSTYRCAYRWRDRVPWQVSSPVGAKSFSMRFCNPNVYHPIANGSSCRTVVTHMTPGTCWQSCNCYTDVEGRTHCDSCPYTCWPSFSSPSQSIDYQSGIVSCTIGWKSEPGGSSIDGYVEWSGGLCVIDRREHPEFVP